MSPKLSWRGCQFIFHFIFACMQENPVNVAQYLKIQSKAGMRCFKLATASQRLRNRAAISFLTAYLLVKYFSKNCLEKLLRNAVWHHYPHCELYQPHDLTLFHTNVTSLPGSSTLQEDPSSSLLFCKTPQSFSLSHHHLITSLCTIRNALPCE